jgi:hypothetical protein
MVSPAADLMKRANGGEVSVNEQEKTVKNAKR